MRAQAAAACAFVRETGKQAAIGSIADLAEIIAGRRGTLISNEVSGLSFHDKAIPA
jgi:carbamate kinase